MRDPKCWNASKRLRLGLLLILAASLFISALALHAQENRATRIARLSSVEGDVQVRNPGEQIWHKPMANSRLEQGDALTTGVGAAEIQFEDGATAYVGENSALGLTELSSGSAADGRITRIALTQGIVRFDANTRGVDTFAVAASGETVSPQQLADFRVEVTGNGLIVRELQGDVVITGANATNWTLRRGQTWAMVPGAAEAKITEAPEPNGYGYWLPLWTSVPPPNSSWLKTPPYSVPIPPAAPPLYLPGGSRAPHVPAARPSSPRFPEQPPAYPERPPRFPQ
jgi:hypothetical protein